MEGSFKLRERTAFETLQPFGYTMAYSHKAKAWMTITEAILTASQDVITVKFPATLENVALIRYGKVRLKTSWVVVKDESYPFYQMLLSK